MPPHTSLPGQTGAPAWHCPILCVSLHMHEVDGNSEGAAVVWLPEAAREVRSSLAPKTSQGNSREEPFLWVILAAEGLDRTCSEMTQGHKTCQSCSHTMRASVLGAPGQPQPAAQPINPLQPEGRLSTFHTMSCFGATPCLPPSAFRYSHQPPHKTTEIPKIPRRHPQKNPSASQTHPSPCPAPFSLDPSHKLESPMPHDRAFNASPHKQEDK